MNLPPVTVKVSIECRDAAIKGLALVLHSANDFYQPSAGSLSGGWVDFHPYAAKQALEALRGAEGRDGAVSLSFTVQQAEAVSKAMLNCTLRKNPDWRKLSLAMRKAINADEPEPTE